MHLLSTQPGRFVEDEAIVTRLNQTPAEIVVLSSADTTLALLSAARTHLAAQDPDFPGLRLVNLLHLRQNASLDLYVDEVLASARVVVVDHLGAASSWTYGMQCITQLARDRGQQLVMFSGDQQEDPDLLARSTVAVAQARLLWQYLRAGGVANAVGFLQVLAQGMAPAGSSPLRPPPPPPRVYPPVAVYVPLRWMENGNPGILGDVNALKASRWQPGNPVAVLVFYRAHLLAGNTLAFDALADALLARGLNPLPLALESLKDSTCLQVLQTLCAEHDAQVVINTTAFAALGEAGGELVGDVPVLQAIACGNSEADWAEDPQGLRPRDIAMQVVLPEVDGRIISRAISFKGLSHHCLLTQVDVLGYVPKPDRVRFVAELAAAWVALRRLPAADKRLALVLANYPGSEGRIGSGVGLDTPATVIGLLAQLERDGLALGDPTLRPANGDELMQLLTAGVANDARQWPLRPAFQSYALADYERRLRSLPAELRAAIVQQWGEPADDPAVRKGRFMIAGIRLGHVFIGIQPARTLAAAGVPQANDAASYHDAELVPPHHYLAFYFWLREAFGAHAVAHVGKHGNLEWLPGKSLALSASCWPDAILGPLPNLYPFIVNDPGEGAQAKRRTQAVIIDHLMPPLARAESHGPLQDLERLVDEYYDALLVDQRRARLLKQAIVEAVRATGLLADLADGRPVAARDTPAGACCPPPAEAGEAREDDALIAQVDAYLCELKETQIRDGLHIFGQSPTGEQRLSTLAALARLPAGDGQGERMGLLQALALDVLGPPEAGQPAFNPLDIEPAVPWSGARPEVLARQSDAAWRTHGDTRERLELLALQVLAQPDLAAGWPHTQAVLGRVLGQIGPALDACGPQELAQFSQALRGRFVPAGPSGSPSRGRLDVLPTGRNFYTVDTRAIPTPTAWKLGLQSAERLIELYLQTHGEYPRELGLSVWGTSTMRTGGDDIAQAFALIGVRPIWAPGSQRVTDFEVLPRVGLHRPRVDVTLRVSGFFRDAFPGVMQMFDAAVQAVAAQEEDEEDNPIRARILADAAQLQQGGLSEAEARARAGWRVFSAAPGRYGTGIHALLQSGQWEGDADLAQAFVSAGAYAYGQQVHGAPAGPELQRRLAQLHIVLQNQDSREHDLLDSSEYSQFQGGMAAAARHYGGQQPELYHGDHGNPEAARIRPLREEIGRIVRARVTNPKWIAGAMRHGYKGAFEMAATVDYLFGFDATARVVGAHHYQALAEAYLFDATVHDFIAGHNPQALVDMHARLLEAISRGMWAAEADTVARLQAQLLAAEGEQEGRHA
ncbi:cobaltochelatase subunit CobN [Comamonas serinivorans]|uniref:Cobaltochelatase subunit CobN n=1 Tax=Comamonas serinivorans TaxID=1082851 RepID=A0A1Y0EL54_9BURK|nr:cobaltochelatase subunit CobN [Comamonas serinivorans]ARU04170.1 cobaltochelatase subunit CobN [Comamonas serinivorans]